MSIFICYAHMDSSWLTRLRVHLKPLERQTSIEVFSDTNIEPDQKWRDRIFQEIEKASVAILLISADFLASDFVNDHELPRLFVGRSSGKKKFFTVFVSPSAYSLFPDIADWQGFNNPDRPLSSLTNSESEGILAKLVNEISIHLERDLESTDKRSPSSRKFWNTLPEIDYSLTHSNRVFSNSRISLPKLVSQVETGILDGFSFQDCWLIGPAVIWAPACNIVGCNFDQAPNEMLSLIMTPRSTSWMLGVVSMNHLNLTNCRISNISFADPNGSFEKILTDLANDAAPTNYD